MIARGAGTLSCTDGPSAHTGWMPNDLPFVITYLIALAGLAWMLQHIGAHYV
jgi:hypothetical protein